MVLLRVFVAAAILSVAASDEQGWDVLVKVLLGTSLFGPTESHVLCDLAADILDTLRNTHHGIANSTIDNCILVSPHELFSLPSVIPSGYVEGYHKLDIHWVGKINLSMTLQGSGLKVRVGFREFSLQGTLIVKASPNLGIGVVDISSLEVISETTATFGNVIKVTAIVHPFVEHFKSSFLKRLREQYHGKWLNIIEEYIIPDLCSALMPLVAWNKLALAANMNKLNWIILARDMTMKFFKKSRYTQTYVSDSLANITTYLNYTSSNSVRKSVKYYDSATCFCHSKSIFRASTSSNSCLACIPTSDINFFESPLQQFIKGDIHNTIQFESVSFTEFWSRMVEGLISTVFLSRHWQYYYLAWMSLQSFHFVEDSENGLKSLDILDFQLVRPETGLFTIGLSSYDGCNRRFNFTIQSHPGILYIMLSSTGKYLHFPFESTVEMSDFSISGNIEVSIPELDLTSTQVRFVELPDYAYSLKFWSLHIWKVSLQLVESGIRRLINYKLRALIDELLQQHFVDAWIDVFSPSDGKQELFCQTLELSKQGSFKMNLRFDGNDLVSEIEKTIKKLRRDLDVIVDGNLKLNNTLHALNECITH